VLFEVLQGPLGFLCPVEFILALQELEKRKSSLPESGDEPVKGCHAPCKFLHIFDYGRCPHISDGSDLFRVGLDAPVTHDEPEQFTRTNAENALGRIELHRYFRRLAKVSSRSAIRPLGLLVFMTTSST
jgi:hypothetical protein